MMRDSFVISKFSNLSRCNSALRGQRKDKKLRASFSDNKALLSTPTNSILIANINLPLHQIVKINFNFTANFG